MTALAADRRTIRIAGDRYAYPVAASVTCYAGGIAALDASGNVTPGSTATGLTAVGIFAERVSNGSTAGAVTATVEPGIFRFANSAAGDAITKAEIGDTCYIVDDQTVAKTNGTGTRSAAGTVMDIDTATGQVWVNLGI